VFFILFDVSLTAKTRPQLWVLTRDLPCQFQKLHIRIHWRPAPFQAELPIIRVFSRQPSTGWVSINLRGIWKYRSWFIFSPGATSRCLKRTSRRGFGQLFSGFYNGSFFSFCLADWRRCFGGSPYRFFVLRRSCRGRILQWLSKDRGSWWKLALIKKSISGFNTSAFFERAFRSRRFRA